MVNRKRSTGVQPVLMLDFKGIKTRHSFGFQCITFFGEAILQSAAMLAPVYFCIVLRQHCLSGQSFLTIPYQIVADVYELGTASIWPYVHANANKTLERLALVSLQLAKTAIGEGSESTVHEHSCICSTFLSISAGQDVRAESKKHKVGRLYMAMLVAKHLQEKLG